MATNSRTRNPRHRGAVVSLAGLARRIANAVGSEPGAGGPPVALLVVRIVEFEKIAWRAGKRTAQRAERTIERAFQRASKRALRGEDCIGHDNGSDIFAVAMLAAPRGNYGPNSLDCRATLERIAHAIDGETNLPVETGWTFLRQLAEEEAIDCEIAVALERGARERERYEFFAAVGHELRTPLTSIRGYLETLLDDQLDLATRRQFTQTAQREAMRLGRLIEGMLDFSMLDLSPEAVQPATCDLGEQIITAYEAIAPLAKRNRMTIDCNGCVSARVGLSADRCTQALLNVIDNAVKHGRRGGFIRIETAFELPYARVRIDDDGPGLALGEHERIFDARIRGSTSGGAGRGLGLAIVKAIVERAGGEVEAGCSPLGGARFELWFPIRAETMQEAS